MNTPLTFPVKAEILVPHRRPMLLVDVLLERSGDYAGGEAVLSGTDICYDHGTFLYEFYIELIAQTSAMAKGYDRIMTGTGKRGGMLVGVDSFAVHAPAPPTSRLFIEAEKTFEFGPVTLISGRVWAGDELLAEGSIKVWENPEGDDAQ